MNNFRELAVWKKSMDFIYDVYCFCKLLPDDEKWSLTSQIKRSSISISSNIAEGCGRNTKKDFARFLSIAIGSSFELETQLIICKRLGYGNVNQIEKLVSELMHIQNMLIKLKKSVHIT